MDVSGSYASAVIVKPIFLPSNTKRLSTEKRDSDKLALCFAEPDARFHISQPPSQDYFFSSLSEEKQPWEPGCSLATLTSYVRWDWLKQRIWCWMSPILKVAVDIARKAVGCFELISEEEGITAAWDLDLYKKNEWISAFTRPVISRWDEPWDYRFNPLKFLTSATSRPRWVTFKVGFPVFCVGVKFVSEPETEAAEFPLADKRDAGTARQKHLLYSQYHCRARLLL